MMTAYVIHRATTRSNTVAVRNAMKRMFLTPTPKTMAWYRQQAQALARRIP